MSQDTLTKLLVIWKPGKRSWVGWQLFWNSKSLIDYLSKNTQTSLEYSKLIDKLDILKKIDSEVRPLLKELFTQSCLDKLTKIIGEDVRIVLRRSLLQIKIDELMQNYIS